MVPDGVGRDEEAFGHRAGIAPGQDGRDHLTLALREPVDAAAAVEHFACGRVPDSDVAQAIAKAQDLAGERTDVVIRGDRVLHLRYRFAADRPTRARDRPVIRSRTSSRSEGRPEAARIGNSASSFVSSARWQLRPAGQAASARPSGQARR
jgi:hypothetical protein